MKYFNRLLVICLLGGWLVAAVFAGPGGGGNSGPVGGGGDFVNPAIEPLEMNGQPINGASNIQNPMVVQITTTWLQNYIAAYDANVTLPITVTFGNIIYVKRNSAGQASTKTLTLQQKQTNTNRSAVFNVIATQDGFYLDCTAPDLFVLNGKWQDAGDKIYCQDRSELEDVSAMSELSCTLGQTTTYLCKTLQGTCSDGGP